MKHPVKVTRLKLLFTLNDIVINLLTEISLHHILNTCDNLPRPFKDEKISCEASAF